MSDYQSFTDDDGVTITSNTRTAEQMKESFQAEKEAAAPKEAPAAPVDELEPSPEPVKAEKRPRDDPKARVAEATRNAAEAKKRIDEVQRRAEAAEAELKRFKESQAKPPEPPKPEEPAKPKTAPSDRPKLDDFDSIEEHTEAVARWVAKQERAEAEKVAKERAFEEFKVKRVETFTGKMKAHLESDPDFWSRQNPDVIALRPLSVMGPSEVATPLNLLAEQFLTSENPVSLIEYFSQHPEEVTRFSQMQSEAEFWRALGKVESGIGSAATTASATKPQISKAAPPPRPVSGGPPTGTPNPNKMSLEESFDYFRTMDKEKRR